MEPTLQENLSFPSSVALLPSQPSNSYIRHISTSFLCGCLGGIANILTSHSLDTIKVRMQILDLKFYSCFKYMVKKEGVGSLYKGITSPLFNVPLIYAIYFGAYEGGKWLQGLKPTDDLTIQQAMIAGATAGFAVTSVMTPVELVKCRLQMEGTGIKGKTISAMRMAKTIVKKSGPRELYKGGIITLLREVPATAVYFGAYEYARKELKKVYGDKQYVPVIAGGVAGLLSWIVSYPQDIVKTKLQCDSGVVRRYANNRRFKDGGIISCAREIWGLKGVTGFTKGFSACSLKAIIAEGATFFVYENMKKYSAY